MSRQTHFLTRYAKFYETWAEGLETAQSSGRVKEAVELAEQISKRFGNLRRMAAELAMARLKLFGDVEGARQHMARIDESDQYQVVETRFSIALFGREMTKAAAYAQDDAFLEKSSPGTGLAQSAIVLHIADLIANVWTAFPASPYRARRGELRLTVVSG